MAGASKMGMGRPSLGLVKGWLVSLRDGWQIGVGLRGNWS